MAVNLIPTPEQYGEALSRPDCLKRAKVIMDFFSESANFTEMDEKTRKHLNEPTSLLKYFQKEAE